MAPTTVIEALEAKYYGELAAPFPLAWRYPEKTPAHPLQAAPADNWPTWDSQKQGRMVKNAPNYFYADLVFPETKCGLSLKGTEARFFITGYCPFTLWVDGVEVFKETHVWKATGPIADPFPVAIKPGKVHKLIACFEPTELPAGFSDFPGGIFVQSAACMDLGVDVSAASAQLRIASGFAATAEEKERVAQAAARIDPDALKANNWDALLRSIAAMEEVLLPFSPRAKAMTVHLVGHTHLDMDWMWTWKDTVQCVRRDAKAVTDMMQDYPQLTFVHSQVPTYQVMKDMDPEVFAQVQRFIKEGRWENAAGTWVEGDLNMADGESIARHMLYAYDWAKENLGSQAKVMWEPDTFGHPGNMPQLAKLGEMDCYFHWRCNPGGDDNWPARVWEGVDGTPIIAFSECYGNNLEPLNIAGNVLNYQRHGFNNALHVWGCGDHGGGLPRFNLAILERYRNKPLIPTFKFDTIAGTLEALRPEVDKMKRNKGETFALFEGCFTTHASIKRYNRLCEGALLTAEALSTVAGVDRRKALKGAWTDMLFNQFHDIMDGAALHDSYINAHARAESALKVAADVAGVALAALVSPDADGSTLVLVNGLGFERTEPVCAALPANTVCLQDAEGRVIPVQKLDDRFVFIAENLPAFARKSYRILEAAPAGAAWTSVAVKEQGEYFHVETRHAASRIHKSSGAIGSYFDKALSLEFVAYGVEKTLQHVPGTRKDLALNVFQVLDEAPNTMSAWLINDILKEEHLLRGAEVTLVESGPVFARFRVKHAFRASKIEEDVIYYQDFARVDFKADIDWRERGNHDVGVPSLRVSFGTAMRAARARSEGPFYVPERTADGIDYPTQKWADVTGENFGFTLLNDSKYAADALGGRLRMTLLRNPYTPDPEPDNGRHTVRFAFVPHGPCISSGELVRSGMSFNRSPVAVRAAGSPVTALPNLRMQGAPSVVCTALRMAEHSERVLIRFFETSGKPARLTFTVGKGIETAEEVNFLEHVVGEPVALSGGQAALSFRPFEVKTVILNTRF